ncbi:hypothetical protein HQ576_04960, partial [bacterium]|nr:hypothetical protein [bacterium]
MTKTTRMMALLLVAWLAAPAWGAGRGKWLPQRVPGDWSQGRLGQYDGFGWYRCFVKVPAAWK